MGGSNAIAVLVMGEGTARGFLQVIETSTLSVLELVEDTHDERYQDIKSVGVGSSGDSVGTS